MEGKATLNVEERLTRSSAMEGQENVERIVKVQKERATSMEEKAMVMMVEESKTPSIKAKSEFAVAMGGNTHCFLQGQPLLFT
ncbi:unnamed protein product [Prunus armeniaca]